MKKFLLIAFSFLFLSAFASHERAGEITFRYIGPSLPPYTYSYEITITTYTKGSSDPADRCSLTINFGDDTVRYLVCRSNGTSGTDPWGATCNNNQNCPNELMGEWNIGTPTLQSQDIKKNIYRINHTYKGAGQYIISMTDPNRNNGIVNIPGNNAAFSIQDTLVINPFLGKPNTSPALNNPPIDRACSGKIFVHNPGAIDPDLDSLSYKLGVCFKDVGTPVTGYSIPAGVSVNPITGDFIWNVPPGLSPNASPCDEYNFAMDIEEWRKWPTGQYIRIGTVRRDMQVTVCNCLNDPPAIANVNDTCIKATTALTFTVTAQDQNGNDIQSFTATGGPFSTTQPATFNSDVPPQKNIATGIFSWTPTCNEVRQQPYSVTFRALDDGAPDPPPNTVYLSDYETFFITVIAPAPENLTAIPQCTNMNLTWKAALCNPVSNLLQGYRVYRKIGCDTFMPGYCETGMPPSWGYSLIATVSYPATTYTDNNGGNGLVHGFIYSYRVVAYYSDGAESYVSDPVCAKLIRDVPIITNVDVTLTVTNGAINVKWLKPLANIANYDTSLSANYGPYSFELLRATGYVPPASLNLIQTFSSTYFASLDTTYPDSPLNTQSSPYTYRVDFYDISTTFCPAKKASSVFLSCKPSDNKIQLTWKEQVPWTNYRYDIYKSNGTSWDSIGTTALQTFTDSGLANGANYCYKVKSIGAYPDPTVPSPLINWSQQLCCSPVDLEPPCPVTLAVDSSCALSQNILSWNNPNNSCSDDALYYIIYYMPVENGDFSVLDTIKDITITTFLDDSLKSIAGCYAVTSVDSFGNESAYSNLVCIDNCPYYELPNVFTPNGDGSNDFFTPLHPYKYVRDIDMKIYNRWGTEVFYTNDPEIMWDGKSVMRLNGKSMQTNMLCSDGVYYYVCIVNDIRLKGIIPRALIGNVHLLSGK